MKFLIQTSSEMIGVFVKNITKETMQNILKFLKFK